MLLKHFCFKSSESGGHLVLKIEEEEGRRNSTGEEGFSF